MKKRLVKTHRGTVAKWDFHVRVLTFERDFLETPTVKDLEWLLGECDKENPLLVNYKTTLHVEELYRVENVAT